MLTLLFSALSLALVRFVLCNPNPLEAKFPRCSQPKGTYSTTSTNGFVPGLFVVSSNLPGATIRRNGQLANRNIVCAHMDSRTSGGTVVIPWAAFDTRDANGRGPFNWRFVQQQMAPWVARGQKVNLLVWPAVQNEDQKFPDGRPATPQFILDQPRLTFQCPSGTTQGTSIGIRQVPKFWLPDVYTKYAQALRQLVRRFENDMNVNYFRFGIGVRAESYPANGVTSPNGFCMNAFIQQFPGATTQARANAAFNEWNNYVARRIRAFRRFNSKKHIIVTVNDFRTRTSGQGLNLFPEMVAKEATREYNGLPKLGLGVQGATTKDIDRWRSQPRRERCNANWCAIFNRYKNSGIPLQLQTPTHSGVNGPPWPDNPDPACQDSRNNGKRGCMRTGNMAMLIDFRVDAGCSDV